MPRTAVTKRPRTQQQIGTVMAIIVLLASAGYVLWNSKFKPDSIVPVNEVSQLRHDVSMVWDWMEPELAGGSKRGEWSLRLNGQWTMEQANRAAAELGLTLELSPDAATAAPRLTYRGELDRSDEQPYKLSMWLQLDDESAEEADEADNPPGKGKPQVSGKAAPYGDAVLLLQAPAGILRTQLIEAAARIEQAAKQAGGHYEGSFAVRGEPEDQAAARRIVQKAAATRQEAYDDGHTVSIAYASSKLRTSIMSGSKRINMQIAEVDGDAGIAAQIVVGVPLITGDYRGQN
ncbi:YwmB family TATA-box binding protein [Paenibacillus mendelii]|uniref:YwmB family TATA-box binding protein n=1 Tax=Paenibacillus mendelii TaxID=206163 RepID=A0ABV6JK23_9BACL|nr:YwmB family TATA-box binding protein [Paenibacillus mendelii]MCQ6559202.1 YwmB family TATA-box binding protein [Paenibacillus mendelii]